MARQVVHYPIKPTWKPKTFTSAEAMMEEVRSIIHTDTRVQRVLAQKTGVSPSTINNIATGKTRWPRSTTLFPLLKTLGYRIAIERE